MSERGHDDRLPIISRRVGVPIIAAAVFLGMVPLPRGVVERVYSTGIYGSLQPALTTLTNLVPWAVLDILVAGTAATGLCILASRIRACARANRPARRRHLLRLALTSATAVAAAYLAFLVCWGFNYRRMPVEERVPFDEARVTTDRVIALAEEATAALNTLHAGSHARPWPEIGAMSGEFAPTFERVVEDLGLGWRPVAGRPKRTLLAPYFRWAAVAGLTNPFGLEVLPGPDTLPFERHAVMAHEWAHLAGFAHEAEAGFVGWLTCLSGDDQARYSGWLDVWPSLVAAVPRPEREGIVGALGEGPRSDLRAIAARNARAVPAVRDAAWRGYDAYLRSQHVPEGVASYQGVVRLMAGTRPEWSRGLKTAGSD